jgi:protein subunit release factor B
MVVSKEKLDQLKERMASLEILDNDLIEKFILGSGKGGQKVNKTSSCVYLKHLPTGIEVKCQQDRSREMNRFLARRELCDKIEQILFKEKSAKQQENEKIRRQKRRRSRRQKEKMLADKQHQGEKKEQRARPKED